ncbi:MAG: UDP-N-acetylglucosamine 1-carboxyvinyltransferase [Anaerolineaceae bacterium]|nr:UDP-N-acetylglucosamine 1-carboxyvinyltransferase [Anaerolineaceae bacterium]
MQQFLIEGGHPLSGEIRASGNKNAAIKMLPACLLTDEPVVLHNMPNIGDVRVVVDLMRKLGAAVEWQDETTLHVHAKEIKHSVLDAELATKIRASVVFAGPLLGRTGMVELPLPGGDSIGERRLDAHVAVFRKLGAVIDFDGRALQIQSDGLRGANILLSEASVTATENAVMAAVLAEGTTVIRNAASEPHVQDLCQMLNALGGQIEGVGSNQITITGVSRLHGGEARVGADFMEVGSLIGAAVVTGGELLIREADPQHLDMVALMFERLGVGWEVRDNDIFVPACQKLTIMPDLGGRIPVIKAHPWPGFPPDLMSIALVVATRSAGAVLFHDWMYESRFFFTDNLVRMGARITLLDPHRVLVQGPTVFRGGGHISSPDIRAGMAMLLAALAAKGETRISNIQQIDRGYERVEQRLAALGAHIERVNVSPAVASDELELVKHVP